MPLDTRHHRFKPQYNFPEEWKITEQRRIELIGYRQALAKRSQKVELSGQLVDGVKQIEEGLAKQERMKEPLADMLLAAQRPGVKGKRVSVRR